jgi:hypothetical protein
MANKSLDGLTIGTFDEVFVSEDVTIDGNLTVNGTITGGLGPSTDNYYLATDASNQFRANSSSVELKSETSTTPTFRLKNSANTTATSTLEVGQINTVTSNSGAFVATDSANQFRANAATVEIQSTASSTPLFKLENNAGVTTSSVLEVGQGNITTVNSAGISNSGTINSTTVTTGTLNATTSNTTGVATSGTSNTGELFVKNARLASNLNDLFIQANNSTVLIRPGSGSANELYNNSTETVIRDGSSNIAWRLTKSTSNVVQRGDLTVGNFDVNGARNLLISNQSSGTDAYSMLTFDANQNANAVLFLNGSGRLGDGGPNVMTMRNDAGDIRIVDATGVAIRLHSPGVTINAATSCFSLNATTSVAANTLSSTTSTSVGGALTVTGTTTLNSPMTQNNATDATDSLAGSIFTWGGLKTVKKMYAGGGVVIPYGQPLQSNTAFTNTKMLEAGYQITNGPIGDDAIYLYAPGNSPGSGSTFVLGANTNQVRLNQTTQSTSTTTGALRVAGGVGIAGNLHVGGTITGGTVSYSTTSSGTFDVTNGTGTTLTVDSTEAATSTTTGCATFAGGVGISGNLHVGGTITGGIITYATTSTGALSVTNSPGTTVTVSSTEESTSTSTGAVTVSGGLGIAKNTIIGGNIELGNTAVNGRRSLTLKNSSTDSSANIAIVFDNANAQNAEIYMAGPNDPFNANDLIMTNNAGNLIFSKSSSNFYLTSGGFFVNARSSFLNTDDATFYNNASTMLSGGLGVAKSVRVGNSITAGQIATTSPNGFNSIEVNNLASDGYAQFKVNSCFIFSNGATRTDDGGAYTTTIRNDAGKLRLQNQGPQSTILLNGSLIESTKLEVTDTTQSTSTSTGALVVDGGLGVDKQAHIGGQMHCTATTSSTSTTTGCARFSGGIGVAENINVGGQINGTATTSSTSTTTGCAVFSGGIGVAQNINVGGIVTAANEIGITRTGNAEMRVSNGGVTEWVFGQRAILDNDFTISSKEGSTVTPRARFNTSGQLKIGTGSFFNYEEGTFVPSIGSASVVTYLYQNGNFVRIGKQVTCTIEIFATWFNGTGSMKFNNLIPTNLPIVNPVIHISPDDMDISTYSLKPAMITYRASVAGYVLSSYSNPNTFASISGDGTISIRATYTYLLP